jgi:hypothetical protein
MTDSSSEDAYRIFSEVLIKCLPLSNSYDELKVYWKDNANMIDGAKKFAPEIYEQIRMAFASRRAEVEKNNG